MRSPTGGVGRETITPRDLYVRRVKKFPTSPSRPEPDRVSRIENAREVTSMDAIGRTRWAIPEGYIPSESKFSDRALVSHETACILNAGQREAKIALTVFFADREPVGPYRISVGAGRTLHL